MTARNSASARGRTGTRPADPADQPVATVLPFRLKLSDLDKSATLSADDRRWGRLVAVYAEALAADKVPQTDSRPHQIIYAAMYEHDADSWVGDGSYEWRCPAHDDRSPSFGIKPEPGDKRPVVMSCRAGCTYAEILTALDLNPADLDPPEIEDAIAAKPTYPEREKFVWVSAEGVPLYAEFRNNLTGQQYMKRLDATGKPMPKRTDGQKELAGVPRVLSELPAVLEVAAEGGVLTVCEGPHAVAAAVRADMNATTLPFGAAAKWLPEHTEAVRGCSMVQLWPDLDEPGYRYMRSVYRALTAEGIPVKIITAATGNPKDDAADHFAAGHTPGDVVEISPAELGKRAGSDDTTKTSDPSDADETAYVLTRASEVKAVMTEWSWAPDGAQLLAAGEFSLLAGREGVGKSLLSGQLAADVTRGVLPGMHEGSPADVIIVAPEDSFEATIKPRLAAADADMDRVWNFRVKLTEGKKGTRELQLSDGDLAKLAHAIRTTKSRLVLLDPIISRLSGAVDTHKDAEVRSQLEPLAEVAHATRCTMLGLIHFNKTTSSDVLNLIMGSRAFVAVARSVLVAMGDPDNPGHILLGQPKNNLGRKMEDEPRCLTYSIEPVEVEVDGLTLPAPKVKWGEAHDGSIRDAAAKIARASIDLKSGGKLNKRDECALWMVRTLRERDGYSEDLADLYKSATGDEGFTKTNFYDAARKLEAAGWLIRERANEVSGKATYRLDVAKAESGATFGFTLTAEVGR